jgi:hypothetical protein
MPVPNSIADLSATIASNSPQGPDAIGTSMDDYLRATAGILKQMVSLGTNIASVNTITLPNDGHAFIVTGTTTITGIAASWNGRAALLRFDGALQLTHNASNFSLPGAANITTAAGDWALFVQTASGVWRCALYGRANGEAIVAPFLRTTGGTVTGDVNFTGAVSVDGVEITATPAELNVLDGVNPTLTAAELNYLDVTTLGTQQASKALTADANNTVTVPSGGEINFASGAALQIAGATVTASAAELNLLDGKSAIGPVSMTAQASTSGAVIDFTGIPTWAKRVTVLMSGVSTNGSSVPLVQIGDGAVVATGYTSSCGVSGAVNAGYGPATTGFVFGGAQSGNVISLVMVLVHLGSNVWACSFCGGLTNSGNPYGIEGGGTVTLAGALDRVRITTTNGTDTFDAGVINVMYE